MKTPSRIKATCILLAGVSVIGFASALKANTDDIEQYRDMYRRPLTIPFEGVTPYSPQLATLGKMLFFDPRLSGAKNMNCASCHNPSFGYEVPVEKAIGAANTPLDRQAPTILNMAWVSPHFWDGRAKTLEEQAEGPITAAVEMNGKFKEIVPTLDGIPEYKKWFTKLFPNEGLTKGTILKAIATYERMVVSGWSPFDRWVEGDQNAISDSAKRGFKLFNTTAKCSGCHTGWNFTDNLFHDIGLKTDDIGRAKLEKDNPKAKHAFKTPGLRNTAYRGPFMHNGSLKSLKDVIRHYMDGGEQRASLSDLMEPVILTSKDEDDLIAFLNTLTADKQETTMPILPN